VKFPGPTVVGANPEIKLPAAGVQVGVKGQTFAVPVWLDVVTVSAAEAELAKVSKATKTRLAAILHLIGRGLFIIRIIITMDQFLRPHIPKAGGRSIT
jgi:hypothetical protein